MTSALLTFICAAFAMQSCSGPEEEGRSEYVYDLADTHVLIDCPNEEWCFSTSDRIAFDVSVTELFLEQLELEVVCVVRTDTHILIDSLKYPALREKFVRWSQPVEFTPSAPGFYRFSVYVTDGRQRTPVRYFNMGFYPENIVSPPDQIEGFDAFWEQTRGELDMVEPDYRLTHLPELSGGVKDVYRVEMKSWGGVGIGGFYSVPKTAGPHPGVMHFLGYGTGVLYPDTNALPEFCELQLSVRGQGIMKETNTYGEWITSGLDSKDTYYYRGAYMDLVRGVDFLCSRPEVDPGNIFAGGGSQGGAFTTVCAALDDRIKAAALYVPFLSDFRDYFSITGWPRSLVEAWLANNPAADWEQVYDVLRWFDIKNFAPGITCPVIMGVGLQDETCPPHINFAAYNLITSEKKYYIYKDEGHNVGSSWWGLRDEFFRSHVTE